MAVTTFQSSVRRNSRNSRTSRVSASTAFEWATTIIIGALASWGAVALIEAASNALWRG